MGSPLDKNKDGIVSRAELKAAIRGVMDEQREEQNNGGKGKKVLKAINNLVFLKVQMPEHLKSIYGGKGTPLSKMHTGGAEKIDIKTCHTHGLEGLRKAPGFSEDGTGKMLPRAKWKPGPLMSKDIHTVTNIGSSVAPGLVKKPYWKPGPVLDAGLHKVNLDKLKGR